jgi:hypothetical protein
MSNEDTKIPAEVISAAVEGKLPDEPRPAFKAPGVMTSPSIGNIMPALIKAQSEIENAAKTETNPHFGQKYADLASVRAAVLGPLTSNGLGYIQLPSYGAGGATVITLLVHNSGEYIANSLTLPVDRPNPQRVGSAITYGRRYSLMAITGVAPDDDDDANEAAGLPSNPQQGQPNQQQGQQAPQGQPNQQPHRQQAQQQPRGQGRPAQPQHPPRQQQAPQGQARAPQADFLNQVYTGTDAQKQYLSRVFNECGVPRDDQEAMAEYILGNGLRLGAVTATVQKHMSDAAPAAPY